MILTVILIALLALAAYRGWRRGLFLEVISLLSMLVSALIATFGYRWLTELLTHFVTPVTSSSQTLAILNSALLQKIESPIVAAVAFSLLFAAANIAIRLLTLALRPFRKILGFGKIGRFVAAILAAATAYFSLQLFLTFLALVPVASLQQLLAGSDFARWMITQTPVTSSFLLKLFIENILHIPAI